MTNFQLIFKFTRRIGILSLLLSASLLLPACSTIKTTPAEKQEEPVSVITGKPGGVKVSNLFKKGQPGAGMPVNALLWRAALDVASFVPLDDVDTFGGSIVTEWHQSADNPDHRLKLTIFILDAELRSDAVKVQAYTQKKLDKDWVDSGRDETLARNLEDLILTRARELRAALVPQTTQ